MSARAASEQNNTEDVKADICVIGAGPAGTAAANRLARLGFDVVLLDRQAFPRPKIGEALAPSILPMLDMLDVRDEIEAAGFLRSDRAIVRWSDGDRDAPASAVDRSGLHVDRARFDDILLRAAARAGAKVRTEAACQRPRQKADGHWTVPVHEGHRVTNVGCRFVIDAAGRRSVIGGHRKRLLPRTLALYGYWREHGLADHGARVEAGAQHWYWAAPLAGGICVAAVFLDPGSILMPRDIEGTYRDLLARSELLRTCLDGRMLGGVQGCSATADAACDVISDTWIKIGEAALCVDPLSAQGVQLAIMTGVQAAAVINTMARRADQLSLATKFYCDQTAYWAHHYGSVSAQFYMQRARIDPQPFWINRSVGATDEAALADRMELSPNQLIKLTPDASIQMTPAITGDYITAVPALVYEGLDRPMAFIANAPVVSILPKTMGPILAGELVANLAPRLGFSAAFAAIRHLWSLGILVKAE